MAQLSSQDIQDFGSFKAPGGALSQNTIDEFGSWQPAKTGKIAMIPFVVSISNPNDTKLENILAKARAD